MARPNAQINMEYFPTPAAVVEQLARYIHVPLPAETRLLDPCLGEGLALAQLGRLLSCPNTYGVELDTNRAREARPRVLRAVQGSYTDLHTAINAFQLLWLNPPYDYDGDRRRMEVTFLRTCNAKGWLQPGGLLVWIVPEATVRRDDARKYLPAWYDQLVCFRFPTVEYARFKQVVVLGVQRARRATLDPWEVPEALPVLGEQDGVEPYALPAPARIKFHFYPGVPDPADIEAIASRVPQDFPEIAAPPVPIEQEVQPLFPLRMGHLAMFLGAGLANNILLRRDGREILVKGRTVRAVDRVEEKTDKGRRITETERLVSRICTLDTASGEITILEGEGKLRPFFEEWAEPLAQEVQARFKPLYGFQVPEDLARVFAGLSPNRPLPGRKESGLFPAQAHAAAAILEKYRRGDRAAVLVGEMGVGKTTAALAVGAGMSLRKQARAGRPVPFLVVVTCPTHLTAKWKREAEEVWPGIRAAVVTSSAQMAGFVRQALASPGVPYLAVVSKEMAKLGSGWEPAYTVRWAAAGSIPNLPRDGKKVWVPSGPNAGAWQEITSQEAGKRAERIRQRLTEHRQRLEGMSAGQRRGWSIPRESYHCPHCGAEVEDANGVPIRNPDYMQQQLRRCFACGGALWQFSRRFEKDNGNPRWPIADFLARRYRGRVDFFIADEVHQAKAQSTDQGYAFGDLVRAARHTICLTGTIFGGTASSLFYLWHRISPRVRQRYAWTDEKRWVENYGVQQTTIDQETRGSGRFTANRRVSRRTKEIPGISPALIPFLLSDALFMRLQDLGYQLPPYTELPHILDMDAVQARDYTALDAALKAEFMQNPGMLSEWLQATLGRPNSCWRDDPATDPKGKVVYVAHALPEDVLYPKEAWLRDACVTEVHQGRKVLVYLRQTATRDIQPRVARILEDAGLRVRVLRQSVDSSRREEWVHREAARCDALICNPKLVEVGLDLVEFPTIIFYEIEYSLYTLMQAARRSWRLGQTRPVQVHWVAYRGTMEHRAISHIGRKVAAASLVYGDEAAAALAEQAGAGRSLLHELAQDILKGAPIADLSELFEQANQATEWLAAMSIDGSVAVWTEETVLPAEPEQALVPAVTIVVPAPPEGAGQLSFFGLFGDTASEAAFTWVETQAGRSRRRR